MRAMVLLVCRSARFQGRRRVFSLNGKACLVIGGSGGIGREIALGLAEQEADVALTYLRRADVAAGLVDRITGLGRGRWPLHATSCSPPA
jgi:NAD(P)-dependent dehydrogenase (short-subunit alcohol dehydrogenase family)